MLFLRFCGFKVPKKNANNSYMRYYVPYKPGDEFKHRTSEGEKSSLLNGFTLYFMVVKLISIKFLERQRELKRIGNMIDDIIASKLSRINEKTKQNVRL